MTRDQHNASYLNLPLHLMPRFNELERTPVKDLPPELVALMKDYAGKYMLCTEVMLMAIADFLRPVRTPTKNLPVHLL